MKKTFTLLLTLLFLGQLIAQTPPLNMTLIGNLPYNQESSDIWGYYHEPTGVEYAIVGLNGGTSVVSLEIPGVPVEIAYFPGTTSIWRDIKTWDHYAYVVNDDGGGLDIIDFSPLPNNPPTKITWTEELPNLGSLDNCHNIFIDEFGYAYLAGSNLNEGGVVILDLNTTPENPTLAGVAPPIYAHDVYVRNNKMYTSDINDGFFSLYDVSNKTTIIFQANQTTPFFYTHNAWLSDDDQYLFTTDELGNAPVASYDVSDPNDIKELDQFRPSETLGEGVIPHNVHVWEDWLVISYYTDGCIIVDASRPDNLIEVGNFDTFIPETTGFDGIWGAYPFLPSDLILASDIGSGLFIFEPDYVKACYLEGVIKSSATNSGLSGATLTITSTNVVEQSKFDGTLKTGLATSGDYQIEISHPAHFPKTLDISLNNGQVTPFDVTLEARPSYAFSGNVKDAATGEVIPDAIVLMSNPDLGNSETLTNANGDFSFSAIIEGEYEIIVGKWGYRTDIITQGVFESSSKDLTLSQGIQDNFSLDLGWTVESNVNQGTWERGAPLAANSPLGPITPGADFMEDDIGNSCYVTGNTSDLFGGVLINGVTKLTSPVFDLSNAGQPELVFASWMFAFNIITENASNEFIEVTISNGSTEVVLDQITYPGLGSPLAWQPNFYNLADFIELTDQMQVSFEVEVPDDIRVAEAGIDFFEVIDFDPPNSTNTVFTTSAVLQAQPNPSNNDFTLSYDLPEDYGSASIQIYNILGREEVTYVIDHPKGNVVFDAPQKGIYLAQIMVDGKITRSIKLVKK